MRSTSHFSKNRKNANRSAPAPIANGQPLPAVIPWVEQNLSLKDASKVYKDLGLLVRSSARFVAARSAASANGKHHDYASAVPDVFLRTPEALVSWIQRHFTRAEAAKVHKALGQMLKAWQAFECRPGMHFIEPVLGI